MTEPTREQQLRTVKGQILDYVEFQERRGSPVTYQASLDRHREQCHENMRDDPLGADVWRHRLGLLDELCITEGVA